jgi:NAD(P)-dependent dehydrogenase (short-subunit alcohol dehydrogenase family)
MNARRHEGKVVFITGGGSGFGRETALRFAHEGAERLYIVDRRAERLETVARELRELGTDVATIEAELAAISECDRAITEAYRDAGRIDVAISNAAAWTEEPFLEMKDESWQRVIAVDLTAGFVIGQRAARAMVESGTRGVILYTASISSLGASKLFAHYSAAKAGLVNLVKTMAVELAPHGIRVNAVSPGPSDTQQSVDIVGEETMTRFRESFPIVPLGRLGRPEDIAAAFSYLASDEAAYVSGANLIVDGALTAHAYSIPEVQE